MRLLKSKKVEMILLEYLIEQGLERDTIIIEDVNNSVYELKKQKTIVIN